METNLEHIHQLLDGDLDPNVESNLYGQLAGDSDLRTEMRQLLAMRAAVQEDRALLVPPAALTNSVFSGLGFAAPLAGAAAGAAGGSMLLQWVARLGAPVIGALAAAGLTLGLMNNTSTGSTAQASSSLTTITQPSQPASNEPLPPLPATHVVTGGTPRKQVVYVTDPAMAKRIAALEEENNQLRTDLRTQSTPPQPQPVSTTSAYTTEPRTASVHLDQSYNVQRVSEPSPYTLRTLAVSPSLSMPGYSIQFRGMALNPTQQTEATQQTSWYDNLGLAIQYRMNANHSLMLEFSNESYPMIFEGTRNGQQIRYEQFPTMFWAGAAYRYTMDEFGMSGVAPYGQVGIGGSSYGPIGRIGTGVQYTPSGPVSFLFGVEASSLAYTFQNQWFLSPKLGLTYGMAVRF